MAEDRPGRFTALRRGLRRVMRTDPTGWAALGLMCLASVVVAAALLGAYSGPKRFTLNVPLPSGMGAVVGGIEACYDSGPPPGGYPWVAGTVALYGRGDQEFLKPLEFGTAAPNADFVVLAPPGDYELAPYTGLSNPAVSVTVGSGHITSQDLRSTGCI